MEFTKNFKEITKESVAEAGGKGASLGEMTNAGIPVPPGFVVLSSAFDKFINDSEIAADIEAILRKVNHKDVNSADKASNEIRAMIAREKLPKELEKQILAQYDSLSRKNRGGGGGLVAVRSSATAEDSKVASWAGELETYLNTDKKTLLKNVKKCWSSLFTTRAIFYRFEKKLHRKRVSVAVVVQQMIQSEVSGICFTVHPVTEAPGQMLIEAGYGLGEAIVSGSITPDSYVIDKNSETLLEVNVAEQEKMIAKTSARFSSRAGGDAWTPVKKNMRGKQKLSGRQILQLASLCKRVETHYGFPCDIEWAFCKGKFYITQSRPITTLKK